MCYHCISRIEAICANKDDQTDKMLADAIQIGKASKRKAWVKKVAHRLYSGYKPLKEKQDS